MFTSEALCFMKIKDKLIKFMLLMGEFVTVFKFRFILCDHWVANPVTYLVTERIVLWEFAFKELYNNMVKLTCAPLTVSFIFFIFSIKLHVIRCVKTIYFI